MIKRASKLPGIAGTHHDCERWHPKKGHFLCYKFIEAYASDLEELPGHLFRADWLHQQMKLCIQGLQEDKACISMDYAENYQGRFQGEVQSAFFDQNKVTIHPKWGKWKMRNV